MKPVFLNWVLYILFTLQAGYSVHVLRSYVSSWWCLTNKKNRRKYSLFAILTIVFICFFDLLIIVFFGVRHKLTVYAKFNLIFTSTYVYFFCTWLWHQWLLYIIMYYRKNILHREGLIKWTG